MDTALFDASIFDASIFDITSRPVCLFDRLIFDAAIFDVCPEPPPRPPVFGRPYRARRRIPERETEEALFLAGLM